MANDFSFSLSTYTNETSQALIHKYIKKAKTLDSGITVLPNIKGPTKLNFIEDTVYFKDGDNCPTFSASGDTILTQGTINAYPVVVDKAWCVDYLEDYWTRELMKPGVNEEIPFQTMLEDLIGQGIAKKIEDASWLGTTAGSVQIDGFYQTLSSCTARTKVDALTGVTITYSNVEDSVRYMYDAVLEELGDEALTLYIPNSIFKLFTAALRTKYSDAALMFSDRGASFQLPWANITVMSTPGLAGTQHMVLTPSWNLIYATDKFDEKTSVRFWYDDYVDFKVKARIRWRMGFGVYFCEYAVCNF